MSDSSFDDVPISAGSIGEVDALPFTSVRCPFDGCSTNGASVPGVRRHISKIHHQDGSKFDLVAETVYAATVFGPNDRKVRVSFYPDDSIRFRAHDAGPMVISEAFMSGVGKHVIIKLEEA